MNVNYCTFNNKLIRVATDKNLDIAILYISLKKPTESNKQETDVERSKTANKKGYFEIVVFEKVGDFKIESNKTEFKSKKDKFITLSSCSIINDTIQNQYFLYLLIQVESISPSSRQYILGYIDISNNSNKLNITNRFSIDVKTTTTTTTTSIFTHKILDGPNVVIHNSSNNTFYVQSIDKESYINSGNNYNNEEYQWISFEHQSSTDSKPISFSTNTITITSSGGGSSSSSNSNCSILDEMVYQLYEVPIVITYTHQPTSIFNKITLQPIQQDQKDKFKNINTILNSLCSTKEITRQNEFHILKTSCDSNLYAILIDTTVLIFKESEEDDDDYDDKPIWEFKLPKKPQNIYFSSLPSLLALSNNKMKLKLKDKDEIEKFKWSQGCLITSYKEDALVQVYSMSTKELLNEITVAQDMYIHDFLSYGFDQLLVRHRPKNKDDKKPSLTIIPLNYLPDNKKVKIIDNDVTKTTIVDNEKQQSQKKPIAYEIIMESLASRSILANQEYKELEQQFKTKQGLLEHSLKVLESFGNPTSLIPNSSNIIPPQISNWNYEFKTLFYKGTDDNRSAAVPTTSTTTAPSIITPIIESKSIIIRGNTLYCNIEFKKSLKPYTIVSVYLCCKDISLSTKFKFTLSDKNHIYGIDIDSTTTTTSLLLESSLDNLNFNDYNTTTDDDNDDKSSSNIVNIFIEWGLTLPQRTASNTSPSKLSNTTNSTFNNINEISYSNDNIYSSLIDSFCLNDYIGKHSSNSDNKKEHNQIELLRKKGSRICFPFELDFIITFTNGSISKFEEILKQILPSTDFIMTKSEDYYENVIIMDESIDKLLTFTSVDYPFINFQFNLNDTSSLSLKVNSVCLFTMISNLKVFIEKLKKQTVAGGSININLSTNKKNENKWNQELRKDILCQIKDELLTIHSSSQDLLNANIFSKKEQKELFLKYHNLYQKIYQSKIETQSLLYHLELLNKFN